MQNTPFRGRTYDELLQVISSLKEELAAEKKKNKKVKKRLTGRGWWALATIFFLVIFSISFIVSINVLTFAANMATGLLFVFVFGCIQGYCVAGESNQAHVIEIKEE